MLHEVGKRTTTATTIVHEPELKTERSEGKEGIYVNIIVKKPRISSPLGRGLWRESLRVVLN